MKNPDKPPKWQEELQKEDFLKLLKESFTDAVLSKIIKTSQDKYLYWGQLKYYFQKPSVDYKKIWALIKLARTPQYKTIKLGNFKFQYYLTDYAQENIHFIDSHAGQLIASDSPFGKVSETERNRYLYNSLMEEAIASSQLEGARTSHKVAKEMLRQNRKPKTIDEQMIFNAYSAMKYIKELFTDDRPKAMTIEMILSAHKMIVNGTLKNPAAEGKFRANNEIVVTDELTGDVVHIPPDYRLVPELMAQFCEFANEKQAMFTHPLIKAIIMHFLIGYIHPFEDGNGRTARSLFYWASLRSGYWTFEFMPISRVIRKAPSQYARAYLYTEYDEADLNYFIHFNVKVMVQAQKELWGYIIQKQKESAEALQLLKQAVKQFNLRQSLILKEIIDQPSRIFTIQEIKVKYNITYQTARTDLLNLVKQGYLQYNEKNKRFLFFKSEQFEQKIKSIITR